MFLTAGWAIITTGSFTLGGVIVTQVGSHWTTKATRRKERNEQINAAVGDLIACGNAWVHAVNDYQAALLQTVILHKGDDAQVSAVSDGRAGIRSAALAYGGAEARVKLTCPPSIIGPADEFRQALQSFDGAAEANMRDLVEKQSAEGIEITPVRTAAQRNRLVDATRAETRAPAIPRSGS